MKRTRSKDGVPNAEKIVCLLCKRKFGSQDQLEKHELFSDLHKDNLAAQARKESEAKAAKAAEEEARQAELEIQRQQQQQQMEEKKLQKQSNSSKAGIAKEGTSAPTNNSAHHPVQDASSHPPTSKEKEEEFNSFRVTGRVKWYNPRRRYGMILSETGDELFLPGKDNTCLTAEDEVTYNPLTMDGKPCGVDIRPTGHERPRCILRAYETWEGHRDYNEDRHTFEELKNWGFFAGLYDGHGGTFSAEYLVKHLHRQISHMFKNKWQMQRASSRQDEVSLILSAIEDGFHRTDQALINHQKQNPSTDDGSTACVCLLVPGLEPAKGHEADYTGQTLFVANCGDCRCLLIRGKNSFRCSEDHKPDRKDEVLRIKKAGGVVGKDSNGVFRVGRKETIGGTDKSYKYLSTSRGFGDRDLKNPLALIVSTPDVKVIDLGKRDWCLVLACDGVWDVMTDQEVATICCENVLQPKTCATAVVRTAFTKGSVDNLSCMVMMFDWLAADAVKDRDGLANGEDQSEVDDMFAT